MTERGWWRRNRAGLIALAVVLPAALAATSWTEWNEIFGSRPSLATEHPADASFEYGGAEWRVLDAARGRPNDSAELTPLPEGVELVVAQLEVTPGADFEGCLLDLAEPARGRSFESVGHDNVWEASAGTTTGCVSDTTEPYVVELPFMVPDDTGDVSLSISVASELPEFVRVPLEIEAKQ